MAQTPKTPSKPAPKPSPKSEKPPALPGNQPEGTIAGGYQPGDYARTPPQLPPERGAAFPGNQPHGGGQHSGTEDQGEQPKVTPADPAELAKAAKVPPKAKAEEKPKTLEDLMGEISKMQAEQLTRKTDEPVVPMVTPELREQMLSALAAEYGTSADAVAKSLSVGDPALTAAVKKGGISPNLEIEELPEGTPLLPVILKRDYWGPRYIKDQWPTPPSPGYEGVNRFTAGTAIRLPIQEARRLIDSGVAERGDPLPGG